MNTLKINNLKKLSHLIKFIKISSKSSNMLLKNQVYTFIVDRTLTKVEIKNIITNLFFKKIKKIRLLNLNNTFFKKVYIFLE